MSQSESLIQIFPIDINQGSIYFPHMGEFIILNSIGEGCFSEVFEGKPKEANNSESSNIFNYIIKICKKFNIVDNNSDKNPPKKIHFNEICEINLLKKIKRKIKGRYVYSYQNSPGLIFKSWYEVLPLNESTFFK